MTEKQKSIIDSALKLFAVKGFDAVPTSAIAKDAGVSEGLIFRHFQNKLGLLNAIMQLGKEKVEPMIELVSQLNEPAAQVQAIMELPFTIAEEEYPFWRLMYSLKWQNEYYNDEMGQPLKSILVNALTQMKYRDVDTEADLILSYIDGFATTILLKGDKVDKDKLLKILRRKYKVD